MSTAMGGSINRRWRPSVHTPSATRATHPSCTWPAKGEGGGGVCLTVNNPLRSARLLYRNKYLRNKYVSLQHFEVVWSRNGGGNIPLFLFFLTHHCCRDVSSHYKKTRQFPDHFDGFFSGFPKKQIEGVVQCYVRSPIHYY